MISHAVIRDRLALDRRSFTELATGFSAITVAGATLYNLGFFAPIEWSLISLLTVRDLLIGSAIGAVPMAVSAWLAVVIGRLIKRAPSRIAASLIMGIPALVVIGFGFFYFYSGPGQSTLGHLACGYLALGVIAATINIMFDSRHTSNIWLLFSLLYIPTVLGMTDSAAATATTRAMSQIETDRGMLQGRVVRVTSADLLLAKDNEIITMPMSKVREIRWFFVNSPAADFLDGTPLPAFDAPLAEAIAAPHS
jgi:hypothetical protein